MLVNNVVAPAHELDFYQKLIDKKNALQAQKDCQSWQDTITVATAQHPEHVVKYGNRVKLARWPGSTPGGQRPTLAVSTAPDIVVIATFSD